MLKRCKNISAGGWPYNICDIRTSQWMSNCDAKIWETTEKKGKQHAQKRDKKLHWMHVYERERERVPTVTQIQFDNKMLPINL